MYFAGSLAQIGALFSGAALSFWRELRQRITEDQGLRAQPMYFIWRLLPMKRK